MTEIRKPDPSLGYTFYTRETENGPFSYLIYLYINKDFVDGRGFIGPTGECKFLDIDCYIINIRQDNVCAKRDHMYFWFKTQDEYMYLINKMQEISQRLPRKICIINNSCTSMYETDLNLPGSNIYFDNNKYINK